MKHTALPSSISARPVTARAAAKPVAAAILAAFAVPAVAQGPTATPSPEPIPNIVVTAGGFEQQLEVAPATITVVSREELQDLQIRNLADALAGVQAIDVNTLDARSNKTGNQTISLRGLPSEYTLVMIDGRRQNVPGTVAPNAFVDSASVFFPPVSAIERIEVVRGPMSTLYGADALGGVVNIITRGAPERWTGSIGVDRIFHGDRAFGDETTLEAYGAGPLIADRLSVQAYGRALDRQASSIRFPGQDLSADARRSMGQNPVAADIYTLGGRLTFTPGDTHELRAGVDVTRQTYDNRRGELGRINNNAAVGEPGFPDLLSGYALELGFNRRQLYVAHYGFFDRGTLESSLQYNFTETTGRTIPTAAATAASGRRGTPRTLETETLVFDTKYALPLGNHTLVVGAQYIDAELTDGIPDATFSTYQYGVFVEDEWQFADRWALTGGVRYDDNSAFGGEFSPRLYLVHQLDGGWTLKGGVARGYRAPFLEQLEAGIIGFGEGGTVPLFGNPNLRPERSTNYEASVAYGNGAELSAQATAFYTEISNKIERPVGATGGTTDNIGEARLRGLELAADWAFARDWRLAGNYTWTDSEITTEAAASLNRGDPLFPIPAHMLNARLEWQPLPAVTAFARGEYRSSRFRPDNFHEPHLGGNAQGAAEALGDFRGYSQLHVGARWQVSEQLGLRATIYNVFDRDFNDYRAYPLRNAPAVTAFSNAYNNILPSRRLWLAADYSF